MTDIHCHILFGLDDGAKTFEDTATMVKMAYDDGIRTIIATHHYDNAYKPDITQVRRTFDSIAGRFPDMEFHLCSECRLDENLLDALRAGKCLTIAGSRYVLTELDSSVLKVTKMMLTNLLNGGYVPVIAHCERLIYQREDLKKISELRDMGCLLQINADAVLRNKLWLKNWIYQSLGKRTVDFIASDAHDPVFRKPLLSKAYETVCRKVGQEIAEEVFSLNARKIIESGGADKK